MKVSHLFLEDAAFRHAEGVLRSVGAGDVLVVSPGETLRAGFDAVLKRQLSDRLDAHDALEALVAPLRGWAGSDAFSEAADAAVDRIYTVLCQGMSLTFRDNTLTDYLRAMFVQLCGACAASMLHAPVFVDGREIILCESLGGLPVIDWPLTEKKFSQLDGSVLTVISGGYGRKVTGETVHLGEGGSFLTANLAASFLHASAVQYFTAGFRYGGSAHLTYEEAAQRFSSGKPVYPPAMLAAKKAGIPSEIIPLEGNAVALTILPASEGPVSKGITGVVSSGPMTLLTVYGSGLLGSVGISSALFGLLARDGINIHFISQSLSEYSISFAVKREDAPKAEKALATLLSDTARSRYAELSYADLPVEIISVFGQGMRHVPGISGRVYSALGQAGVNVVASSQGGEELSISIVVLEEEAKRAQEALEAL